MREGLGEALGHAEDLQRDAFALSEARDAGLQREAELQAALAHLQAAAAAQEAATEAQLEVGLNRRDELERLVAGLTGRLEEVAAAKVEAEGRAAAAAAAESAAAEGAAVLLDVRRALAARSAEVDDEKAARLAAERRGAEQQLARAGRWRRS